MDLDPPTASFASRSLLTMQTLGKRLVTVYRFLYSIANELIFADDATKHASIVATRDGAHFI
jgi:hypothetical protein